MGKDDVRTHTKTGFLRSATAERWYPTVGRSNHEPGQYYDSSSGNAEAAVTDSLTIDIDHSDEGSTVVLTGELDADNCHRLQSETADIGNGAVTMDLGGLDFVDSSGIGQIVKFKERVGRSGGTFTIIAMSPSVQKVLEITGLLDYLGAS
jgi:anti-anti-sigma factor